MMALLACKPAGHLSENEVVLNRNRILIENAEVKSDDLKSFVRQQPNRRLLGLIRMNLLVYNLADRLGDGRISQWVKRSMGEAPVLYNPVLAESTLRQFRLYMENKGYFNARVEMQLDQKNRGVVVNYLIDGGRPYLVRQVDYRITDPHLASYVYKDTINRLFQPGNQYDADLLQQERNRIARQLKNEGFFEFSREFIFFDVDSTLASWQLDIDVVIRDPAEVRPGRRDSLHTPRHRIFMLDSIFIYPEFAPMRPGKVYPDTTVYRAGRQEDGAEYVFVHRGPMPIRPRAIVNNILLEAGTRYRISDVEQSYTQLSRLRNFRFINIQFTENRSSSPHGPGDSLGYLNTRIQLVRAPARAFTIEAEGLNSAGNLGLGGNLIYHNRNFLGGAELFNIRLKAAMEVSGESSTDRIFRGLPFNTGELGADFSIDFPKLLFPVRMDWLSRTARPKSTLLAGINYRQRPDYTRYVLNFSYGFEWSQNRQTKHHLYPFELSSIKIFNDSLLRAKFPDNNPLLLSRFNDHLIAGTKYSYVYSTQQLDRAQDFMFFMGNLELAGNMLYLGSRLFDAPRDPGGSYQVFNIAFAQYLKADFDIRHYRHFLPDNILAVRLMAGAGLPFGNLDVMPFIKSFYGGGANSLRAWTIYSLGPGGYQDEERVATFDRYGDIKLEANLEYRFGVYRFIHGALFADAGNVWFLKENPEFPRGEFSFDRFYREIAIGAGLGLRLDFNFFVVRLDAAFPLRNPALPDGARWIGAFPEWRKWNFNLGIGYPF